MIEKLLQIIRSTSKVEEPKMSTEDRIRLLISVFRKHELSDQEIPWLLGQIEAEIGPTFEPIREGKLAYSSIDSLRKVFGSTFAHFTDEEIQRRFVGSINTIALYNYVYDDYLSHKKLGNRLIGDGYKYRGGGYIQITGKSLYERADAFLNLNGELLRNTDLVLLPEYAARIAAFYWIVSVNKFTRNQCLAYDSKVCREVTRAINPSLNRLEVRCKTTEHWISEFKRYI